MEYRVQTYICINKIKWYFDNWGNEVNQSEEKVFNKWWWKKNDTHTNTDTSLPNIFLPSKYSLPNTRTSEFTSSLSSRIFELFNFIHDIFWGKCNNLRKGKSSWLQKTAEATRRKGATSLSFSLVMYTGYHPKVGAALTLLSQH